MKFLTINNAVNAKDAGADQFTAAVSADSFTHACAIARLTNSTSATAFIMVQVSMDATSPTNWADCNGVDATNTFTILSPTISANGVTSSPTTLISARWVRGKWHINGTTNGLVSIDLHLRNNGA